MQIPGSRPCSTHLDSLAESFCHRVPHCRLYLKTYHTSSCTWSSSRHAQSTISRSRVAILWALFQTLRSSCSCFLYQMDLSIHLEQLLARSLSRITYAQSKLRAPSCTRLLAFKRALSLASRCKTGGIWPLRAESHCRNRHCLGVEIFSSKFPR